MRRSIDDLPGYRSRVRGCLLGGGLGDALGAPVEFESIGRIRRQYGSAGVTGFVPDWRGKIGLITDDTQMTLFTVEGLIRGAAEEGTPSGTSGAAVAPGASGQTAASGTSGGTAVPGAEAAAVRDAYLRWLDTQRRPSPPPADGAVRTGWLREQGWLYSQRAPGNACLSGLRHEQATAAPFGEPGPVNPGSKGCGTVMRSAPFGFDARDARHAFDLAAECAQITHGHPTGYLAAGAFAALVHFVMEGRSLTRAVRESMDLLATYPSHEETSLALRAAISLAAQGAPSPEKVESLGGAWIAEEALAISVYCALAHPEPGDLRDALLLAVNHSGDSDSTGAVCGNLLGALHGEAALPADWLAHLEGRETIVELADDFTTQATEGHPTTEAWLRRYPRG
ncbi:ADP-ribosylglycohydrolase family protein [Streptosporangium sp. NPDC051023]|uniref:ADP-ribosylglycohydrolase family protein n=1 Tax=Streptosporangium sp. NPDC051023 TaxID=3155410 RepID=UPI00344D7089